MLATAHGSSCRSGQRQLLSLLRRPRAAGRVPSLPYPSRSSRRGQSAQAYSAHNAKLGDVRNIGIIAHVDAGKTTTTERMLYLSGASRHLGNVDHGDTVTDFLPLEREKGITIQSAAITFHWPPRAELPPGAEPKTINLIDTPGHQDFRFEVDRCLPVLDGAVCILDAVKGVEAHTERVWASAQQWRVPRVVYVNKLDRDGASFRRCVLELAARLGTYPLVCQIPWWDREAFAGVIDVVDRAGLRWSGTTGAMTRTGPAHLQPLLAREDPGLWAEVERARVRLVEALSERDDQLMAEFLEREADVPAASIRRSIRRLVADGGGAVAPVLAGASLRNMGVQPLLDAVVDYLPSPRERPEVEVRTGDGATRPLSRVLAEVAAAAGGGGGSQHRPAIGALASVFKVVHDPRRGMLSYVRVYHGTLHKRDAMWNTNMHRFEKPLGMLHVAADRAVDVPHLPTGHIGALTGLPHARTGDTLLTFPTHRAPASLRGLQIRPPEIPPAVTFVSIDADSPTEAQSLQRALESLSREDPSLRWTRDERTDQFVLSGMGKLHLEIAQDRLRRHYRVAAEFGAIAVDYKECVLAPAGPRRAEYERTVANKPGRAACSASVAPLGPEDQDEHRDRAQDQAHGGRETRLASGVERDGNVIHIAIPLPPSSSSESESGSSASLPFDAEVVRQQLFNGAVAALARGPRRGSPVTQSRVTVTYDPQTDYFGPVSGAHVVNAAIHAVRDVLREAHAQKAVGLLEPFMRVRITCPESAGGSIQHDIAAARGGVVLEVRNHDAAQEASGGVDDEGEGGGGGGGGGGVAAVDLSGVYAPPDAYESRQGLEDDPRRGAARTLDIVALVPLQEMLHYDDALRGLTGGRHSLQMELDRFERVLGPREKAVDAL